MVKIGSYLFLFMIALLGVSEATGQYYDLQIERLRGKVKRIDESKAVVKFDKGVQKEGDGQRFRTVIFDKKGSKTYEWIKISNLDPFEHFYAYDDDKRHRRTVRSGFQVDAAKPLESYSYSVFRFDPVTRVLHEEIFPGRESDRNARTQGYTFQFDEKGRLADSTMLDAQLKPVIKKEFIFVADHLPVEMRIGPLTSNGRTQSIKYIYELDVNGNWIRQSIVNTLADENATTKLEAIYRKIEYYR